MHAVRTGRCRRAQAKQSNVKARAQGKEAHPCAFGCFVLHEALRQVQVLHLQPRQPRLRLILVLCSAEGTPRVSASVTQPRQRSDGGARAARRASSSPLAAAATAFSRSSCGRNTTRGSSAHSAQSKEKRSCASQRGAARTAAASSAPRARAAARSARVAASSAVSRATSASRAAAASRAASAAWLASAHAWGWSNAQRSSARRKRERRRKRSNACGLSDLVRLRELCLQPLQLLLQLQRRGAARRRLLRVPQRRRQRLRFRCQRLTIKSLACKLRASRSALSVASSAPASAARRVASRAAAVAAACAAKTPRKGSTSRALRADTAARSADTTAASSMPAAAGRTARHGWPADVAREVRTDTHAGGVRPVTCHCGHCSALRVAWSALRQLTRAPLSRRPCANALL